MRISTDVTLTATYPMFLAKGCFEFLLSPCVQVQEEYFHFPALVQTQNIFLLLEPRHNETAAAAEPR